MRARAVFLDKDGTLVKDVPYNVDPGLLELSAGAGAALRLLAGHGYRLFVVSNQAGIAKGLFAEHALRSIEQRLSALLEAQQVALDGFYYCPHHPGGMVARYAMSCDCRKPQPGMLLRAADVHGIDLAASWMIGDILDDVEAGHRAGCKSILLDNGNETQWRMSALRRPDLRVSNLLCAAKAIVKHEPRRHQPVPAFKAVKS